MYRFLLLVLLVACGDASRALPEDLAVEGQFVREAWPLPRGRIELLVETPLSFRAEAIGPHRTLVSVGNDGAQKTLLDSTLDRSLLDVARHPSGERSAIFATDERFVLVRIGASGEVLGETEIDDPDYLTDPPIRPNMPDLPPREVLTRDAGRIEAHGEDVIAATRTGRHSVIAYRFRFADGAFTQAHRTLVVPAHGVIPVGLTGGSYDTFAQMEHEHSVYLAVDEEGLTYVGTVFRLGSTRGVRNAHEQVFGETLVGDPDGTDSYVTRLAADGTRLGTSVISTELPDEMYGLRAAKGAAFVLGRNETWNAEGTGHDAFVARVDAESGAVSVHTFDVRLGDIAFDAIPLPDGRLVVLGASGYTQNPHGASISDDATAFARVLAADGTFTDLTIPDTARQDIAYFGVALPDGRVLVAGMHDGPGTHTADGDLSLVYADGFLMALTP